MKRAVSSAVPAWFGTVIGALLIAFALGVSLFAVLLIVAMNVWIVRHTW